MVSIALATYNGERFLKEQLDSILNQTYTDIEIIACDDCSTDSTPKILEEYHNKDSRFKYFINEKNLGFKKNFEKCISLCNSEYIALSDQDDVWTKDHIECLISNIGENDLICGNAYLVNSELSESETTLYSTLDVDYLPESKDAWFFYLIHHGIIQGACTLFKKDLLQKALPIPDSVRFHDYWLSLVAAANQGVKYLPENCLLYYRQHENNVTENKKFSFSDRIKKAFNNQSLKTKKEIQINILSEFLKIETDSIKLNQIKKALLFYKRKGTLSRFLSIPYFLKNYKKIYLSTNKKRFILRFVKFFVFGF